MLVAPVGAALAAPGDLDPSFGTGGKVTLDFGGTDRATHVALAPDGRIVVLGLTDATGGGDFAVARFTSAGAPDPTFGTGGKETIGTQPGVNDIGGGVVVLPDERIIVSGQGDATDDFVAKRLSANGTVDPSFGSGGTSVVDFGGNDIPNQMVAQPDGKLVLAGATGTDGHHDFAVARLNADGTPDTGFGSDGKVTIDFGGDDIAYGLAVQADGKIVVAGQGDPDAEMSIARLNADGTLDPTFGSDGEATIDLGGPSGAYALALQPDGKIVLAGTTTAVGAGDFAVARLTSSGSLDPTFNGTGKQTLGYGAANEAALGVVVQPNGRIVVMGNGGVNHDFPVTRLNSNGTIDTTFGTGGTVGVDFGATEQDGDLALQPDGKLVLAGSTNVHDGDDFALARLQGDPVNTGGGGGQIGGAGSTPPDPTLQLSVTPTNPIATVPTTFTFTVHQYGNRRPNAYVSIDGLRRKATGSGTVRLRLTLDLHPYTATATFPGAPNGSVTITPRYVPRLALRVSPSRPTVGRLTTLVVYVTLRGKPARNAYVTIGSQRRRTNSRGYVSFTVLLEHHSYDVTATRSGALEGTFVVRPVFPGPFP